MTIDKQNGEVAFSEATHQYFNVKDPKKKYISVTTLIHKFEPPFDRNFWSAFKAVEQLVNPDYWRTAKKDLLASRNCNEAFLNSYEIPLEDFNSVQQEILDLWQKENLASTHRGTEIHANLEHSFYAQGSDISLQKYGVGGKFTCVQGKTDLDLENGIYPEYLIYYESPDQKIRLAGQIDLLAKEGDSFSILDWKGLPLDTKIPTLHGWKTMADIAIGDKLFDKNGEPCAVLHKSEIHNNPCFKIIFEGGEEVTADEDHKWLVNLINGEDINMWTEQVMTTKEIKEYLAKDHKHKIAIMDAKPLVTTDINLNRIGFITPWDFATATERAESIKHYLRASVSQRLEMLENIMYTYVARNSEKDLFYVKPTVCADAISELLTTLGCHVQKDHKGILSFPSLPDKFAKAINLPRGNHKNYRIIKSVKSTKKVPTQCIEVDSPTHTYLCTEMMLPTHNTNKQIKISSYYNQATKKSEKLKYPLNDLDNCNYSTYNMQLSTYAWMVQQLHPEWSCKELVLVHFDYNNNMTVYKMDYLKDQVERMLNFWKKQSVLDEHRAMNKRIEY